MQGKNKGIRLWARNILFFVHEYFLPQRPPGFLNAVLAPRLEFKFKKIFKSKRSVLTLIISSLLLYAGVFYSRVLGGVAYISPEEYAPVASAEDNDDFLLWEARPDIKVFKYGSPEPVGLNPEQARKVYDFPARGGSGTIAIVGAFGVPNIEKDINIFSSEYGLSECTLLSGCLEVQGGTTRIDPNWALTITGAAEWAHVVAPDAKLLIVISPTNKLSDLLGSVNYARNRQDVVAVSLSWGVKEFAEESSYNHHFKSQTGAVFFGQLGESGTHWPAVSPYVISVGGTTLHWRDNGVFDKETAWSHSEGGVSKYEPEPSYQRRYGVPNAGGKRVVPDVAINADPASGYSVYLSTPYRGQKGWLQVGGTGMGPALWAGLYSHNFLYGHESLYVSKIELRDITRGSNKNCLFYFLIVECFFNFCF